ncbi:MAG: ASKHA domain-containing protein, partial [Ruminiclostridium sp.]
IKNVYLAGGFGTYINIASALQIGLIPSQLKGKIQTVGNAAGQGAIEGLLSLESLYQADIVSKKIKYIELSASKDFNDFYIDCMMFE